MNRDPQAWKRLGQALKRAREARGLSQGELAERADVSKASVHSAESGAVPKLRMPYTLGPIATALGWPAAAVEAVLDGGAPPVGAWVDMDVQGRISAVEAEGIVSSAMVRAADSATGAEIRVATAIVVDELRRRGVISETDGAQPPKDHAHG
jgi:transcriptional regulator with XRE-family HTH domain